MNTDVIRRSVGRFFVSLPVGSFLAFLLLCLAQAPGQIVADTKYDLHSDPVGFLARAGHLWTDLSFSGQIQNQAYGYFFPQGAFFAVGHLAAIPPWIVERVWWALLLTVAMVGLVRLAEKLDIGTPATRLVAGVAFALSPRMLAELGPISSEIWPVALAPWLWLAVARGLQGEISPRRAGALAALVLALMGAVNAVATLVACLPAVLWWALHRPSATWWRLAAWWAPLSALVITWWLVPLALLGRLSPPFLDYIESAQVTTRWSSVPEVLRGAGTWVQFVATERMAGAELTGEPLFVLATGGVAAACVVGLVLPSMPHRGRLAVIAAIGLVALTAAWAGPAGGLAAEPFRSFLDGSGAPLRNIHKFEPLLRIPLDLGLAHLLGLAVRRIDRSRSTPAAVLAHPERDRAVTAAGLVVVMLLISVAPAWLGRLAPGGGHPEVPDHWHAAASWLAEHAPAGSAPDAHGDGDEGPATRALVVPGSRFGVQVWGVTRDEPLQPLAETPWTVRDAIPLQPAPAIRALDSVQHLFADGRPAPGLAATLHAQGIGFLVVRNDLDPDSGAPDPGLVRQVTEGSGGLEKVAAFGQHDGGDSGPDPSDDARPAIEIYRVASGTPAEAGGAADDTEQAVAPESPTAPYLVDLGDVERVAGGPEVLARLDDLRAAADTDAGADAEPAPRHTRVLEADARAAGLEPAPVLLTDTPGDREADFGRLDHSVSALRAPNEPLRGRGVVRDYAATIGDPDGSTTTVEALERVSPTRAQWRGGTLTASSSASEVTQPGAILPGTGPAAALSTDPEVAWRSGGLGGAFGEWLRIDLDEPIDRGQVAFTVPSRPDGLEVTRVRIETAGGTVNVEVTPDDEAIGVLPPGQTDYVEIRATGVSGGGRGTSFELAGLQVFSGADQVPIRQVAQLPAAPRDQSVWGWVLGQDFLGRPACVGGARCEPGREIGPEEPRWFLRSIDVPTPTAVEPQVLVRPRPGEGMTTLLAGDPEQSADQVRARGRAAVADPRAGPGAAVDGDPRTAWVADPRDPSPLLRLELPEAESVAGVRFTAGDPGLPREVTISTGATSTRVDLTELDADSDGAVVAEVPPEYTDRVDVRIDLGAPDEDDADEDERDTASSTPVGIGLADVEVVDGSGDAIGAAPPRPDSVVELPCGEGPIVFAGGDEVQTSVTATRAELLSGAALVARPCGDAVVDLDEGRSDVLVDPGPVLTVDALALTDPDADAAQSAPAAGEAAVVTRWGPDRRIVEVPPSDTERLLVVPESANPGWVPRLLAAGSGEGESQLLQRVTVNGWQQGYLLPASSEPRTVALEMESDGLYRMALATGPPALLLVAALWLWRRSAQPGGPATPLTGGPVIGAVAVAGTAALVGGWWGLGAAAVVAALTVAVLRRRGERVAGGVLLTVAGVGIAGGAVLLARTPWPAGDYAGDTLGPQLLSVVGVCAAGALCCLRPRRYESKE